MNGCFQVNCHYSAQATIVEFWPHFLSVHGCPDPSRQQTDLAVLQWQLGSVPQQRWPAGDAAGPAAADFDCVDERAARHLPGTGGERPPFSRAASPIPF